MTNIKSLIERAEQALEGVTEGPWRTVDLRHQKRGKVQIWPASGIDLASVRSMANAAFIAAARTIVPELVAALRDAEDRAYCFMHENKTPRRIISAPSAPQPSACDHPESPALSHRSQAAF